MPLIGWIIAGIGGFIKSVAEKAAIDGAMRAALWAAQKVFIWFIVCTVVPVVLYNVFVGLIGDLIQYAMDKIASGGFSALTIEITGMAGWIGNQVNMAGVFATYLSAIALRFTLAITRIV